MRRNKRQAVYYQIRAELFWIMLLCLLLVLGMGIGRSCGFLSQEELTDPAADGQLRVEITYDDWRSELTDPRQCFLCGENTRSRIRSYAGLDTIGLISLNDWAVIPFQLTESSGETAQNRKSSGTLYGNTGEVSYLSSGDPSRGMARLSITLPENLQMDGEFIRQNLCQNCLDKVTSSLKTWRWEKEEKEALPLCLIDFMTLEIYPLQDWYRAYFIRDYWMEMDLKGTSLSVKAYYLPKQSETSSVTDHFQS